MTPETSEPYYILGSQTTVTDEEVIDVNYIVELNAHLIDQNLMELGSFSLLNVYMDGEDIQLRTNGVVLSEN